MAKFNTPTIEFDKIYLQKLVDDENSGVVLKRLPHHLAVHPFMLNEGVDSITEILKPGIAKYNKKLGGILMGYQNIKVLDSQGVINADSCFIHFDIEADFFVFKPEIGQVLVGTVNKKSADHVGCLVHKTFNVSLPKPEDDDDWIGTSVQIAQEIVLRVTFTSFDARLPYIRGTIVSMPSEQDSGISTSEENITNSGETVKKNKKRKRSLSESVEKETLKRHKTHSHEKFRDTEKDYNIDHNKEDVNEVETNFETEQQHKKKKKKKHSMDKHDDIPVKNISVENLESENVFYDYNQQFEEMQISSKKHKKKSKRDNRESTSFNGESTIIENISVETEIENHRKNVLDEHENRSKKQKKKQKEKETKDYASASGKSSTVSPNTNIMNESLTKRHKKKKSMDKDSLISELSQEQKEKERYASSGDEFLAEEFSKKQKQIETNDYANASDKSITMNHPNTHMNESLTKKHKKKKSNDQSSLITELLQKQKEHASSGDEVLAKESSKKQKKKRKQIETNDCARINDPSTSIGNENASKKHKKKKSNDQNSLIAELLQKQIEKEHCVISGDEFLAKGSSKKQKKNQKLIETNDCARISDKSMDNDPNTYIVNENTSKKHKKKKSNERNSLIDELLQEQKHSELSVSFQNESSANISFKKENIDKKPKKKKSNDRNSLIAELLQEQRAKSFRDDFIVNNENVGKKNKKRKSDDRNSLIAELLREQKGKQDYADAIDNVNETMNKKPKKKKSNDQNSLISELMSMEINTTMHRRSPSKADKNKTSKSKKDSMVENVQEEEFVSPNTSTLTSSREQKKHKKHKIKPDIAETYFTDSEYVRKKSKRKRSNSISDISLPDLNLKELFKEITPRKLEHDKRNSAHNSSFNIQLPPDSDLENILSGFETSSGKKQKQKRKRE